MPTWETFGFSPAELTELRISDLSELIAAYESAAQSMREIQDQLEQLAAHAPERVHRLRQADHRSGRQGGLLRAAAG